MKFFNTFGSVDFVVGEEHATTAKMEAKTNKGGKCIKLQHWKTGSEKSNIGIV